MKIDAQLDGDLEGALTRWGAKVGEQLIYSGAAAAADEIRDEVESNVSGVKGESFPGVVTGNLKGSIYMAKDKGLSNKLKAVYDVSWNKVKAPHGHLLEFGTSRMAAKPFVRPAAAALPRAIKRGIQKMRDKLAELTRGG